MVFLEQAALNGLIGSYEKELEAARFTKRKAVGLASLVFNEGQMSELSKLNLENKTLAVQNGMAIAQMRHKVEMAKLQKQLVAL